MGYPKGRQSRSTLIEAATRAALARGFSGCSMNDLSVAAGTTMGKITHHFPSKSSLFEEVGERAIEQFEDRLTHLNDETLHGAARLAKFLDDLQATYAAQEGPIGCIAGLTAVDTVGASELMRERALALFIKTRKALENVLLAMGRSPADARDCALLVLSTWQGAVVIGRAGAGSSYLRAAFSALKTQLGASASQSIQIKSKPRSF